MRRVLLAAVILGTATAAQAADMPDFLRGSLIPAVPALPNWQGFYVGGQASYGSLIDQKGLVVSVESAAWKLSTGKVVPATIAPAKGQPRHLNAMPVSAGRANIDLAADDALLSDLQVSEHATVKIGAVTLKLPFDDFNAARVTFEICVQKLGKDWTGN